MTPGNYQMECNFNFQVSLITIPPKDDFPSVRLFETGPICRVCPAKHCKCCLISFSVLLEKYSFRKNTVVRTSEQACLNNISFTFTDVVHGIVSSADATTNSPVDIQSLFKNAESVLFEGPATPGM